MLPAADKRIPNDRKRAFLEALPEGVEFTCGEAVKIRETLGIRRHTVNKYLNQMAGTFLEQPSYGRYFKNVCVPSMPSVPSSKSRHGRHSRHGCILSFEMFELFELFELSELGLVGLTP